MHAQSIRGTIDLNSGGSKLRGEHWLMFQGTVDLCRILVCRDLLGDLLRSHVCAMSIVVSSPL